MNVGNTSNFLSKYLWRGKHKTSWFVIGIFIPILDFTYFSDNIATRNAKILKDLVAIQRIIEGKPIESENINSDLPKYKLRNIILQSHCRKFETFALNYFAKFLEWSYNPVSKNSQEILLFDSKFLCISILFA